jgi:glycosyltransferase involved in cell wall biosynthesis
MRHYRHAACLQAVSGAVADAIQAELGAGTSTQVCVVPNPIARRASLPPPASARGNHILYTGRLHPEKGLHLLLNAWRLASPRLEGWKLRIVGPWRAEQGGGGSAFLETLHRAAAGIPVDFVEPIFDIEELNREYASASFFVYPSLAALGESFGLAPLEAMAFATPAIVSGLACFRDFISPGENGLVFDHMGGAAAAELADRIALLGTNTALRLQLGAAAWETSARFTESAVADSYLAEFVRLLR